MRRKASFGDKEYARAAVEYYVDQIIRSEAMRAEFCHGQSMTP